MQVKLVNILTYVPILSYKNGGTTGMRYNIKGRWQPGHQCESFHWSIIYTVSLSNDPLTAGSRVYTLDFNRSLLEFAYTLLKDVVFVRCFVTTADPDC